MNTRHDDARTIALTGTVSRRAALRGIGGAGIATALGIAVHGRAGATEEKPMTMSRSIRVFFMLVLAAGAMLFSSVQPGLADPNLDQDDIPPHRHFVETPSGELVEVGPRVCDDPSLQDAFNQFHSNVHHALSPISPPGTAPGPGPVNGAPGLHNHVGADLTFRACSFVP